MEMTTDKKKESQDGRGQAKGRARPRRKHKQGNKLAFANHSTTGTRMSRASETLGPGSGCHEADGFLRACKLVPPLHVRRIEAFL